MSTSELPMSEIRSFCEKWKVREFALFGSILRDDFRPESDVDVLVTFEDNHGWGLFELADMSLELEALFDRRVDLLTRTGVEQSRNRIRREAILNSTEVIYAA